MEEGGHHSFQAHVHGDGNPTHRTHLHVHDGDIGGFCGHGMTDISSLINGADTFSRGKNCGDLGVDRGRVGHHEDAGHGTRL